jgi:hypothetical protein
VEAVDLLPASTTWRMPSNAEILADSGTATAPMPALKWTRAPSPTFTPALMPGRVHVPARVPARPLAHAAPRESAHVHNTAPQPALPRHPRLVPKAQAAAGQHGRHHRPVRGLQRSSGL